MGGRLYDWLGSGVAADLPAAPGMAALLGGAGSTAVYFETDTKIFQIYDESGPSWFAIDAAALAAIALSTMPDVDVSGIADGDVLKWDVGSSLWIPLTLLFNTLEQLQDAVGAMFANGTGITASYNDGTGMVEINCTITQYTDELAQDALNAAFAAGTHTGITVTYNDGANSLSLDVLPEFINDTVAALIAAGTHIGLTITYDDALNKISFTNTITQYTDEMARDALGAALTPGNGIKITPNDGADIITVEIGPITVAAEQTGANYTVVAGDANTMIPMNRATGQTLTLPQDSDAVLPIGTRIFIYQKGAGTSVFTAGAGATVQSRGAAVTTAGQYAVANALKVLANTWLVSGDVV